MIVDSHAHLDARPFARDRDQVMARAREAGVVAVVTIGTDLASSRAAIALAEHYPDVYASVGLHPHDARAMDDDYLDALATLARHPRVVAIGETGIDLYRNLSPLEAQLDAFRRQMALAASRGLPLIVHSRNARDEVLALLEEWAQGRTGPLGVLHCYSGDVALALRYIEMGFLISVAGPVTYKSSDAAAVASEVPLGSMLIETDCPFLAPQPHRGKRNEPAYLTMVVERIAALKGMASQEVAEATARNAASLFGLPL